MVTDRRQPVGDGIAAADGREPATEAGEERAKLVERSLAFGDEHTAGAGHDHAGGEGAQVQVRASLHRCEGMGGEDGRHEGRRRKKRRLNPPGELQRRGRRNQQGRLKPEGRASPLQEARNVG